MNPSRTRANSKIIVQSSESRPYETVSPKLVEIQISEKFSGDIDGDSPARALQVQRDDKSASMVSMQRFSGTLNGRHGAFVLQGTETVENGRINATWFVVPGSGTGDLRGLRGEGGFKGDFGKGSDGWLDYWFEWSDSIKNQYIHRPHRRSPSARTCSCQRNKMQRNILLEMVRQNQFTSHFSFDRVTEEKASLRLNDQTASIGFIYRHVGETIMTSAITESWLNEDTECFKTSSKTVLKKIGWNQSILLSLALFPE
jgi:hypothetical protein